MRWFTRLLARARTLTAGSDSVSCGPRRRMKRLRRLASCLKNRLRAQRRAQRLRKVVVNRMLRNLRDKVKQQERDLSDERRKTHELEERLSVWESNVRGAHRAVSSLQGVVWQYEDEGDWHTMPPEGNDQMHQLYLRYLHDPDPEHEETRVATVYSAGVPREVDFHLMQQTRCGTKMVRRIRMLLGVPAEWTTPAAALLQQGNWVRPLYVQVSDQDFLSKVRDILRLTGHAGDASQGCSCMQQAQVKSAYRIENLRLWHGFKLRREALRKQHDSLKVTVTPVALDLDEFDAGGLLRIMTRYQDYFNCSEPLARDVNEKILLHGTTWHNANMIALNGFDHRTCECGMYGDGTYFASSACKSHQYAPAGGSYFCGSKGERTLIISRVALGDAYLAMETLEEERRPPLRNAACGDTYDSIVVEPGPMLGHPDGRQIHQEFVIFDNQQAYPAFVVQYEC